MFTQLPETTQHYLLRDAEKRDPVTARRSHLARLLLRERYLTRESLMFRVESLMGFASFGEKSWKDNFYRDMRVVKAALKQAGFKLKTMPYDTISIGIEGVLAPNYPFWLKKKMDDHIFMGDKTAVRNMARLLDNLRFVEAKAFYLVGKKGEVVA